MDEQITPTGTNTDPANVNPVVTPAAPAEPAPTPATPDVAPVATPAPAPAAEPSPVVPVPEAPAPVAAAPTLESAPVVPVPAPATPVPPVAAPSEVAAVSAPVAETASATIASSVVPAEDPMKKAAASDTGKKKVLIVEDERPLAHALELKLSHEGYEPIVSLTGADGLKQALTGTFAVILLDLIMPELDGFSLLEQLQKDGIKTPVIVLSNLGQEEDKTKAKSLGAADYFVKANTPILEIVKRMKAVML